MNQTYKMKQFKETGKRHNHQVFFWKSYLYFNTTKINYVYFKSYFSNCIIVKDRINPTKISIIIETNMAYFRGFSVQPFVFSYETLLVLTTLCLKFRNQAPSMLCLRFQTVFTKESFPVFPGRNSLRCLI